MELSRFGRSVQRARPQSAQIDSRDPFHAAADLSARSWTAPDLARKLYRVASPASSVAKDLARRSAHPAVAHDGLTARKSRLEPGGGSVRGMCARGGKNDPGRASSLAGWPHVRGCDTITAAEGAVEIGEVAEAGVERERCNGAFS